MTATRDADANPALPLPTLPPPPIPPRPDECCGQGCVHCVYVVYDLALLAWEREVERLQADAEASGAGRGSG